MVQGLSFLLMVRSSYSPSSTLVSLWFSCVLKLVTKINGVSNYTSSKFPLLLSVNFHQLHGSRVGEFCDRGVCVFETECATLCGSHV
jgi:hypothetical protein